MRQLRGACPCLRASGQSPGEFPVSASAWGAAGNVPAGRLSPHLQRLSSTLRRVRFVARRVAARIISRAHPRRCPVRRTDDPAYLPAHHSRSSFGFVNTPLAGTRPVLAAPVWAASAAQIQQHGRQELLALGDLGCRRRAPLGPCVPPVRIGLLGCVDGISSPVYVAVLWPVTTTVR